MHTLSLEQALFLEESYYTFEEFRIITTYTELDILLGKAECKIMLTQNNLTADNVVAYVQNNEYRFHKLDGEFNENMLILWQMMLTNQKGL